MPIAARMLSAMLFLPCAVQAAEPAMEFYNVGLNHYFLTAFADEATGIDNGAAGPGWHRTGRVFGVYLTAAEAPAEALPVCRFYGNQAQGGPNGHFYTADPAECAAVKRDPGWTYEGIAFYVRLPQAGACAPNMQAVYRNYNQRFPQHDSNHRYTTDAALHGEMTAIGWADENIVFCADASIVTPSAPRTPLAVSGLTPLADGCDATAVNGNLYRNSEVEPMVAADPRAPDHLIGAFQQDRWSNGGARGVIAATSFDGGRSWQKAMAAFSRCTGGNAQNGADFLRASDPWVSIAPDGTAYQIVIAFNGGVLQAGSDNAVLISRSTDGGATWDRPTALMRDGNSAFNDKESVTADPTDAAYAYAVWDRLVTDQAGASLMARTTNGGLSWEPARVVYDPGTAHQTINNQLVVLPDGSLVVFFSELGTAADGKTPIALMGIVRSTDKGLTWSPRIKVTDIQAVGTTDPRTGESLRDGGGLGQIAADRSGKLYIVWQDARYTGARDAVLLTTSTDGGLTWSTPVRVNADPTVPAFTPAIALARDGTIGVTYYDLRSYASGSAALLTDYWLARSGDGVNWVEVRAGGPFDMGFAPDAGGLFLGDYQALAAVGNIFLPFFAQANSDADNRSDIMAAVLAPDLLAKEFGAAYRAPLVGNAQPVPGFAQRVQANLTRARLLRLPGMGTSTR